MKTYGTAKSYKANANGTLAFAMPRELKETIMLVHGEQFIVSADEKRIILERTETRKVKR